MIALICAISKTNLIETKNKGKGMGGNGVEWVEVIEGYRFPDIRWINSRDLIYSLVVILIINMLTIYL